VFQLSSINDWFTKKFTTSGLENVVQQQNQQNSQT